MKIRLVHLNVEAENPALWDDQNKAQIILKEKTLIETKINNFNHFNAEFNESIELYQLAESEEDHDLIKDIELRLSEISKKAKKIETECLFSDENDYRDTFLEIHPGAGGTESHDWANMLYRMYRRWCERHRFKYEEVYVLDGEEAGIKSATIKVFGNNAFGWLKNESGVHRLVRQSPFNAANKRQTSFASVGVYPVVDDDINIEIVEKDLRIDTFRSSGAGGQHVNTTDSAVRITHLPTNIVVQCQNDRSQHKNKAECLKMLKSRLYELEIKKRMDDKNATHSSQTEIGWGHQIRSYVLHPYQLVKDLRTDYETSDTNGVLDGDLDDFMQAMLKKSAIEKKN